MKNNNKNKIQTNEKAIDIAEESVIQGMRRRGIDEGMNMHGFLTVVHTNAKTHKKTTLVKDRHNVLTNAGRDRIHNAIYENQGAASQLGFTHMGLTTNDQEELASHTTLAGEISSGGLARADADTTTHGAGSNTSTIKHLFTATAVHTNVQKSGLFDSNSGGTMGHENTFTPVTLQNDDTLEVTWTITLG